MSIADLNSLAEALRKQIICAVAENGGHLASNCGAVELIVALHRVFDVPAEKIFFDVGHQAYAHKLLTGRQDGFTRLRKIDGISGFPNPDESPCDPAPAGHAGTALSLALGAAAADPDAPERIIAVLGDGCIGCGITFEALNNISSNPGRERLVLIINDNQMSISRNVGALSVYLNKIISGGMYNALRRHLKRRLLPLPRLFYPVRKIVYGLKRLLVPRGSFFEAFGMRYLGPVDGHNIGQMIRVLEQLRKSDGPVVLHVSTRKGAGCSFAEENPTVYHGVSGCDPQSGAMRTSAPGFSSAFGEAMVRIAGENPLLYAVSAAMIDGTGLTKFAEKFPERIFDTGIAEEHAITFAASLAVNGKRPVCAIYDTFLQRALDGVYHDAILAKSPLVIIADRAGVVEDGPTHHGIYNCGFLRSLPDLVIASPSRCEDVEAFLRWALEQHSPVVLRYPRGGTPDLTLKENPPLQLGKAAIVRHSDAPEQIVIWSIGAELSTALATAGILTQRGVAVSVVDARFLKPFDRELARKFAVFRQFTVENHSVAGGLYSALTESCSDIEHKPITGFGWPDDEIIPHGQVDKLREKYGLTCAALAERILAVL